MVGVLETKLRKVSGAPTVHYLFLFAEFEQWLVKFLNNGKSTNLTMQSEETLQSSYSETTPKTTTKSKSKNGRKSASVKDLHFPAELLTHEFGYVFSSWLAARVEMRKPCTTRAAQMQLKKLAPFGEAHATELVERSIANGWQGIVFEGDKQRARATVAQPQRPQGGAI